jgi:KDO2-lipid IV(A) lauroyltransferase
MTSAHATDAAQRETAAHGAADYPRDWHPPESIGLPRARAIQPSGPELGWVSRINFWLLLSALHAVSLLPDFVLYPLGMLGGLAAFHLDRRHVRIGLKNLEIAYPHNSAAARRRILRESYLNLGRSAAEYIRLAGFFYRRLARRVRYVPRFDIDKFLPLYHGQGILVLTAHFGNFELLPSAHAMHGFQISLVHRTQRLLAADKLMTFVRERAGVQIIRKYAAARAVVRALKDGDLVGIPFDQNVKRREAVFVPFFDLPAATSTGLARLAEMSDAAVLPVFLVREPDGRHHRIEIHEPIMLQRSGDVEADVAENTRRFVKAVEDMVRRYPEQFLWTHRRYRTRPLGENPVYEWELQKSRRRKR